MIPTQNRVQVESNIQGRHADFALDARATQHLIGVLTNLYSDREMAALREISTNARDGHIAAGCPERPIEVTLPSNLSAFLKVRDYGTGLSPDDLLDVYTKYGASTKRDTNDQNGCLGLGCKSPLAYTSQFSLTSVKDGVKSIATITKKSDGVPDLTVIEQPSDEPNGVEVVIPARRDNTFAEKAEDLFRFWEPGTVLVNGKPPEPIKGLRVSEEHLIIDGHQSYVVMAGVPYPARVRHGLDNGALVTWVPTGSVDFVPSREALEDTDTTKDALAAVAEHFHIVVKGLVQRAVEEADSYIGALRIATRWHRTVPKVAREKRYYWRGESLPMTWKDPQGSKITLTSRAGRTLSGCQRVNSIAPQTWLNNALWVYDYSLKFTAGHKRKLNGYIAERGLEDVTSYVLTVAPPDSRLVDPSRVVPWDTIKAVKVAAPSQGYYDGPRKTQRAGAYDCWVGGCFGPNVPADEIVGTVYWMQGNREETAQYGCALPHLDADAVLVALPRNRVEKFTREWPEAIPYEKGVAALHAKWFAGLSRVERKALAMVEEDERSTYRPWSFRNDPTYRSRLWGSDRTMEELRLLDPERLNDPRLRLAIKLAQRAVAVEEMRDRFAAAGIHTDPGITTLAHPLDSYPLFCEDQATHDHTYIYLNAAYAAGKES